MNKNYEYSLKKRAKTFYFASIFFNKKLRNDINTLYTFCRYIDDLGDAGIISKNDAKLKLKRIIKDINNCKSKNNIIKNFIFLMIEYNIKKNIPIMLIMGVIQDLGKVKFKNFDDLIIYSYKVAGTVGLMICNILRVEDKNLKFKGIQLGIAMQITNIIRDIEEDISRDRIYFPQIYRSAKETNTKKILESKDLQQSFSKDLKKLIELSDAIYNNSWQGIQKLKLNYRFPIAVASKLYQSIGHKIRKKKYNVWGQRHYLNILEKLNKTILVCLKLLFIRKTIINKKLEIKIKNTLINLDRSFSD